MSTRYVHQSAGVADMDSAYGASAPVKVDTDDDQFKWKTNDGVVRSAAYVGQGDPVTSYTADGAITPTDGVVLLSKLVSFGAFTLAAPVAADAGKVMAIHSTTDFAHTITATGLILDGVTGGAKDVATFPAFAGASIVLRVVGLFYSVESLNVVTVA